MPTREVGTGAVMIEGFQPEEALMAAPPSEGSVQATTGNATATSPLIGTVVDGAAPVVDVVEPSLLDPVEPMTEDPQPASSAQPATAVARLPRRRLTGRGVRSTNGVRVMSVDDRPAQPCSDSQVGFPGDHDVDVCVKVIPGPGTSVGVDR